MNKFFFGYIMTKALSEIFLYPKKGENLRISYEKWEGDDGRRKQSRLEQQRWRRLRRDLWLRRLRIFAGASVGRRPPHRKERPASLCNALSWWPSSLESLVRRMPKLIHMWISFVWIWGPSQEGASPHIWSSLVRLVNIWFVRRRRNIWTMQTDKLTTNCHMCLHTCK